MVWCRHRFQGCDEYFEFQSTNQSFERSFNTIEYQITLLALSTGEETRMENQDSLCIRNLELHTRMVRQICEIHIQWAVCAWKKFQGYLPGCNWILDYNPPKWT